MPTLSARLIAVVFALALQAPCAVSAAEIAVLGTAHLATLQPAPDAAQRDVVLQRLAAYAPTRVCIEAIPGERIEAFLADPGRHGELLSVFAMDAVRLAGEQQVRLGLDGRQARVEAGRLAASTALDEAGQVRLVGLQLAGHEPWSAALNWSRLSPAQREAAKKRLGRFAAERLEALVASDNEISSLALPLARSLGQRSLCAVDPFVDELGVNALAEELMPVLGDPAVGQGLEAFNQLQASHWKADRATGLAELLAWMNSDAFAEADLAAEWTVFARGDGHDAGRRRLMLWHARNAEIVAYLARELAREDGGRVLLLIGGAHRPFLQASLRALPWVEVRDAQALLSTP